MTEVTPGEVMRIVPVPNLLTVICVCVGGREPIGGGWVKSLQESLYTQLHGHVLGQHG